MITLRRATERYHDRLRKHDIWWTFDTLDGTESLANGFGALENFNEERFAPGASVRLRLRNNSEIITYVFEGALAQEDSTGHSGVIYTGEFQRITAGRGIHHSQTNASRTNWAHVFQIRLHPSEPGLKPSYEQKRFSAAQRRDGLCVVASQDGRQGSLRVHQDALVCSAILDPGQHLVHELPSGRSAWLHVVRGEATISDLVLVAGDGVGVTAEIAVSFTAGEETEILLLDLKGLPKSPEDRGAL